MKNNKLTITIGIPAYNEEANIYHLLKSIISQKINKGILEKIIVISDGSIDQTVDQARKINDKRLMIINNKKRKGAMIAQNQILKIANSDILIMLNADVILSGKNFVNEIIKPILQDEKIGIVGADTISLAGRTFIERVIVKSHEFKKNIYKQIRNGNNLYLCHGRARAFSKKLYKNFEWANESPEDAFSYLTCIKNDFKFMYSPNAKIKFRSPSSLADHKKQSDRFRKGQKNLLKYFDKDFVITQCNIPKTIIIREIFISIIKSPLLMLSYLGLNFSLILFSENTYIDYSKIEPSESSKTLII